MIFVKRMKKLRKTMGYGQKEFSELLGVGYSTYQQYGIKHIEPKLAFLERLCLKFPEYTLWLMTERTDPPNHIDPYMHEMRQQRIKDEESL